MCGGFGNASMKSGSAGEFLLIDVSAPFPTRLQRFFHSANRRGRTRFGLTHFQVHLPPHPLSLLTAIALPGSGKAGTSRAQTAAPTARAEAALRGPTGRSRASAHRGSHLATAAVTPRGPGAGGLLPGR